MNQIGWNTQAANVDARVRRTALWMWTNTMVHPKLYPA